MHFETGITYAHLCTSHALVHVQAAMKTADVLYYRSQQVQGPPERKAFPDQLRLVAAIDSAAADKELGDPKFMCQVSNVHRIARAR
jgi:hypothetical protein